VVIGLGGGSSTRRKGNARPFRSAGSSLQTLYAGGRRKRRNEKRRTKHTARGVLDRQVATCHKFTCRMEGMIHGGRERRSGRGGPIDRRGKSSAPPAIQQPRYTGREGRQTNSGKELRVHSTRTLTPHIGGRFRPGLKMPVGVER